LAVPTTNVSCLDGRGAERMAEWRFKVLGSEPALVRLSECLPGVGWWLTREAGEWYLVRNEAPKGVNEAVFADDARLIIRRINMLFEFTIPNHEALYLRSSSMLLKDDGTRLYLVQVDVPLPIEFGHSVKVGRLGDQVLVDVIWERPSSPSGASFDYKRACERLAADPAAERVIKSFLDRPRDWCKIYNVIELVEHRCGGRIPAAWASGGRVKRLKGTACSWSEAGRTGRHANPNLRGPGKPMRVETANRWQDVLSEFGSNIRSKQRAVRRVLPSRGSGSCATAHRLFAVRWDRYCACDLQRYAIAPATSGPIQTEGTRGNPSTARG
jgi:hypothetical protein